MYEYRLQCICKLSDFKTKIQIFITAPEEEGEEEDDGEEENVKLKDPDAHVLC